MAKEPNHFVYEDDEFGTEGIEIIPPPEDPIAELDAEIARVDAILKAAGESVDVADAEIKALRRVNDEDQPRVPKGNPNGGQWVSEQGSWGGSTFSDDWKTHGKSKIISIFENSEISPRDLAESLAPAGFDFSAAEVKISARDKNLIVEVISPDTKIQRTFSMSKNEGLVVSHDYFRLSTELQGKGQGRSALARSMDLYKRAGVKKIELDAQLHMGAYVWAKFGFSPSDDEWSELRPKIISRLQIKGERELLKSLRSDGGPLDYGAGGKAIWKIADLPNGKDLLSGGQITWKGSLDLSDTEAMSRFAKYAGGQ